MKQLGVLLLACALVAGCDDENTTAPSTTQPNTIRFTATLSPASEVPPVANAESTGRGTANITFNLTRNTTGAIQSGNIDFRFDLNSFPANTVITGAHIHPGAAGVNGGVLINTGLTAATALGLPTGAGSWEGRGITADAATLQSIVDNPGNFYFNVHSPTNPGGAARGQLVRQQ